MQGISFKQARRASFLVNNEVLLVIICLYWQNKATSIKQYCFVSLPIDASVPFIGLFHVLVTSGSVTLT